ncbi:MAG: hypothetical protein ABJG41_02390 [Cyclobacteriaceae bacterium]
MKKVILLLSLLLSLSSCREDDFDILPSITQEGLNTFGCLIDWEVLVPKDAEPNFAIGASGLSVRYVKDSLKNSDKPPYFSILASNYKNKGGDLIYIYIPSLSQIGTFPLGSSNGYMGIDSPPQPNVFVNVYDRDDNFKRYLSFYKSGQITITRFDTTNTIISGYFDLKVIDQDTGMDTIEIRDGRFDINWRTLNCGKTLWHQPCP